MNRRSVCHKFSRNSIESYGLRTNQCSKRAGKRRLLGMEATHFVTSAYSRRIVCRIFSINELPRQPFHDVVS